jgi:mannan endo-1,4-beta-mannosidase
MVKIHYKSILTVLVFTVLKLSAFSTNHAAVSNPINHNYMDRSTSALYSNLKKLSEEKKIMFGCANPTTLKYKELFIYEGFDNSDCKEITGDNPAFQESDFMWHIKDSLKIADIKASKKAFARGAVVGYCWHIRGMKSNSFYSKKGNEFTEDKELAKKITSGIQRDKNPELDWLLTRYDSVVIPVLKEFGFPVVFRPWHEMNGGWFWWGSQNITPDEYISLYRITVDYLREKGIRNVLYAWSPDTRATFDYYPGDDYVDILGLDIYEPGIYDYKPMSLVLNELGKITDYAADHGKVAAITETGLRKEDGKFIYPEVHPDFWTKYLLEPIINDPKACRIVWIESWYNADWGKNCEGQFYIPYKGIANERINGQQSIDDFLQFYKHSSTLFEKDLPDMYK